MDVLKLKKLEKDRLQMMVYVQSTEIKIMECELQIGRLQEDLISKKQMLSDIEDQIKMETENV